jgi:hypothetical protein
VVHGGVTVEGAAVDVVVGTGCRVPVDGKLGQRIRREARAE